MSKILLSKLLGLILSLSIIFFGLESSYSTLLFLIIMLTIGIPHGSVDHIVAFVNPKARRFKSKFIFYLVYLSLIIANTILWIISPFIGLALFLVISCYHFGETQVIGFHNTSNKLLNFVVGANILLSLFLNNITYDDSQPTISLINPISNSNVKSSNISYELSETMSNIEIFWERIGGSRDGISEHTISLVDDELIMGSFEDKVLINKPQLQEGAIYNLKIFGFDLAGNMSNEIFVDICVYV